MLALVTIHSADVVIGGSHVVPDRVESFRILAVLRDAEVAPSSGGRRILLRVAVLARDHVDRDPLGVRVGGVEGKHRLGARVVPRNPAVGHAEAAVRHFFVTVGVLRDVLGDVALRIQVGHVGDPLSGTLGRRAVLDVAGIVDNPVRIVRVVISLDPRPEGAEVVAVAAEAVGVVLTVAVRIVFRERTHDFFKLVDRGRNLEFKVVEPVLTDPEHFTGRLCNVARDSVDRAGIIGCEEQGVRVHLVVVVADVRILRNVRCNIDEQARVDPLLILRIHAPPPDRVRQLVAGHDQLDLRRAVRVTRENVQRDVHVVHLFKPLLDLTVRLLIAVHDRYGQIHRLFLIQNVDRFGISRVTSFTAVSRSAGFAAGRRCGGISAVAARCKNAYAQSQREDKAEDFLHVHDENSFLFYKFDCMFFRGGCPPRDNPTLKTARGGKS